MPSSESVSWSDFPLAGEAAPGEIELEQNGWLALVAFEAGPAHARLRARSPERGAEEIYEEMAIYLADAGIPLPPKNYEWLLSLPEGINEEMFWEVLNAAVGEEIDLLADVQKSGERIPETPLRGIRREASRVLRGLYDD